MSPDFHESLVKSTTLFNAPVSEAGARDTLLKNENFESVLDEIAAYETELLASLSSGAKGSHRVSE